MQSREYNSLLAYARSKQANEEDKEEKEKPGLLSRAAPYVAGAAGAGLGMVGAGMLRDYLRGSGFFAPKAKPFVGPPSPTAKQMMQAALPAFDFTQMPRVTRHNMNPIGKDKAKGLLSQLQGPMLRAGNVGLKRTAAKAAPVVVNELNKVRSGITRLPQLAPVLRSGLSESLKRFADKYSR